MKRLISFCFLLLAGLITKAQTTKNVADTAKPAQIAMAEIMKPPVDSNILIVVNGTVAGTIRELKKDINKMFPVDIIESIDVLKGFRATDKYGDKGKAGVLEFSLKGVKIEDVNSKNEVQINLADSAASKVDEQASFPGGDVAWRRFLETNLNANTPVDNGAPEGTYTVMVQFVVDKDGTISELKALTNHGYGLESEVIRLLGKIPKWKPAVLNGQFVKSYRKQPVTFVVMSEFELSTRTVKAGEPTAIEIKGLDYMKDDEIEVTLSSGTISYVSGKKYIVTVDKPGKVFLKVTAKGKKKKDNYEIGTVEIEVR